VFEDCEFGTGPLSALTGNEMHNQNPIVPMRDVRTLRSVVIAIDLIIDRHGQIALNDGPMRQVAKVDWRLNRDALFTGRFRSIGSMLLWIVSLVLDADQQCSDQHNNQESRFH
jgi:hypothetical protein